LRFAGELSSATVAGSGWNLRPGTEPLSVSPFATGDQTSQRDGNSSGAGSILLVEDNPADALLVEEALKEHRVIAELVVLGDGEKAIRFIEEFDATTGPYPKLVILDLNLPKRNGKDVLRHIRQSPKWKHVPVVILTSSNTPTDREEAARLGANRYIRKPSELEDFLNIGAVLKNLIYNDFLPDATRLDVS
jgi:CheY-like chemotaxis protein